MIEVTEPQVWVLIGVFGALMFSMLAVVTGGFVRILRSEIGRIDARFDAVDARFDAVEVRFQALDRRLDHLDRDVQAIARRVFPEQS